MIEHRDSTGGTIRIVPSNPFDYAHAKHAGSWLLRYCAMCGAELEFLGETLSEATARDRNEDAFGGCKYQDRDMLQDHDDHDRCQCEGRIRFE